MIYLKAFYSKYFFKYGVIFLLLFSAVNVFLSLIKTFNYSIANEEKNEIYRTISISGNDLNNILRESKVNIESYEYDEENNEYIVVFYKIDDVQKFLNQYAENIDTIARQPFTDTSYSKTKVFFVGTMIIVLMIIVFLIVVFLTNIIQMFEKNIALFKLVGYRDIKIIFILFSFILVFYFIICSMSFIVEYIVMKLLVSNFVNDIILLSIKDYFMILLIVLIIISSIFIIKITIIKKISPIKLIHSN